MVDIPALLTVEEVADRLRCNPETVYRAVRARRLACYRVQSCIRIAPDDLTAYLESTRCPALDQSAPSLSSGVASGASSGGTETHADEFRRGQAIRSSLDRASRTLNPALSVVQQT